MTDESKKTPPPEDVIESDDEIDMGEIESLQDDMDLDDDGMDLSNFLVTEDGETVANSLADIGDGLRELVSQISTTNKILIKMLSKLS